MSEEQEKNRRIYGRGRRDGYDAGTRDGVYTGYQYGKIDGYDRGFKDAAKVGGAIALGVTGIAVALKFLFGGNDN